MQSVVVHGKTFNCLFSDAQIQQRIQTVCSTIVAEYQDRKPVFLAVLNGAFMFAADVLKNIPIACEITFVKLKSYIGDQSSGKVKNMIGLDMDLQGRDVVVLEDIVDTGETMLQFLPVLLDMKPRSVAIFSMLVKRAALKYPIRLDYVGFEISNEFVVGYCLGYDGYGRNFKDIYQLAPNE